MTTPEKSSDEILKELFGMCQQRRILESGESSQGGSSEDSDGSSITQKRHKRKKKKKHKKGKKRRRSLSVDSQESENKSHKKKKKKSRKECNGEDSVGSQCKKIELTIKQENDDVTSNVDRKPVACDSVRSDDNLSQNYMDTVTGKSLTLDDVFSTLGIVTESSVPVKIKKEKEDKISELLKVKEEKEEILPTAQEVTVKTESTGPKEDSKSEAVDKQKKNSITDVFDDSCKKATDAEKQKAGPKKISIKNLKNSTVYEATIKEIEERERLKAEKYEEGEITSSSSSTDSDSAHEEVVNKDRSSHGEKENRPHKHKKRSKSCGRSGSKHRSRSHKRKHHRRKSEDREHKSRDKHRSSDRRHKRKTSSSHSRHHHHHHHSRSLSAESKNSSVSQRSHNSRSRKRERSRESRSGPHSRKRSKERKSNSAEKIDKQKLLEIARKNAISLLQQGALPASVIASKDKLTSIKAGGKTVDELTDFCKKLSKKDADGHESISSDSEADSGDDDKGKPFHHPFQLKERPASIVMNIRNSVPLPTKTAQEKTLELSKQLSLQYPVSSGQQHRTTENVWVPVEKPSESAVVPQTSKVVHAQIRDPNVNLVYPIKPAASCPMPPVFPPALTNAIMPPENGMGVDISSIVAQRLEAIRRLSENPRDPVGTNLIQSVDSKMTVWAESKVQPGLFTGSTGVKPLTVAELSSGYKAWPKKNQFTAAKPVCSDKGEALMKKMGWQPGEGLGKYKQGPAAPCEISMKTDRKGLAEQPVTKTFKQRNTLQKAFEITQNKHPVSLLNEFCSRKKIGVPQYSCEEKEGAGRRKLFLFTVTVQGVQYTSNMPSTNKKQSKVEAATVCLQTLGLLPVDPPTV